MGYEDNPNRDDESPPQEPAATPLVSAEELSTSQYPVVHIPDNRRYAFGEFARRLSNSWRGSIDDHLLSKLGEFGYAKPLGIEKNVDTEIYTDGGDGGIDLRYRGATIDVKTVGQHQPDPALRVNAYKPLRADYYALASRISESDVRLIGYAPRTFVAKDRDRSDNNGAYHTVDQRYLFPFPPTLI